MTGQLKWPNGLVIDAASQKLFWADAGMDKIEYSNLDVRSFVLFLLVCEAEHSTNQLSISVIWGHGSHINMRDFLTLIESL